VHVTLITPQVVRLVIKGCFYGNVNAYHLTNVQGVHTQRSIIASVNTVIRHVTGVLTRLPSVLPAPGIRISMITNVN
jgi:hypothetical protein